MEGEGDVDDLSIADILKSEVTSVGSVNPVSDYKALLAKKTKDMLVPASTQLMQRIDDIVDLYVGGPTGHFKDMVLALRQGVMASEPKMFNSFLQKLKDSILAMPAQRKPFLEELKGDNIIPISSAESAESDVDPGAARGFWTAAAAPVVPALASAPMEEDADDLLEDL